MNALAMLRADIGRYEINLRDADWDAICDNASACEATNRNTLLGSNGISQSWVFIASGFAATYYSHRDGRQTLTRFFQPGQLAGNVTSTWSQDYGSDELIAIGDVTYVELPHQYVLQQYMHATSIGSYIRLKVIETLRYDKDLLVCQSLNDPKARFLFLKDRHPQLLEIALKKDIAAFMGVTPQGFSRFLRRETANEPRLS